MVEELGFTSALTMESEDLVKKLKQLCPSGINVFVDYTSGKPSDSVILQVRLVALVMKWVFNNL